MKVTPYFVENLSGSVGGITAAKARGGIQYFRFRAIPTNPNTGRQQLIRGAVAQLTQTWQSLLSQADRDSWIAKAEGSEKQGLNEFIRTNSYRLQAQAPIVDQYTGPLITAIGLDIVLTLAVQTPGGNFQLSATGDITFITETDDATLSLYMTRPIPPSRTFENRSRLATSLIGDSGTPPTFPVVAPNPWLQSWPLGGYAVRSRAVATFPTGDIIEFPIAPTVTPNP